MHGTLINRHGAVLSGSEQRWDGRVLGNATHGKLHPSMCHGGFNLRSQRRCSSPEIVVAAGKDEHTLSEMNINETSGIK